MRDSYDFTKGVRGKYAEEYKKGTNVVLLDEDLRKKFPTDKAVNDALRQYLELQQRASGE